MPTYDFPCWASAGKLDSAGWEWDFEITPEEEERLKSVKATEFDSLFDYPEISDIAERIYRLVLETQADVYLCDNEPYIMEEVREINDIRQDEEITIDHVVNWLEHNYRFGVRFPEEFVNDEKDDEDNDFFLEDEETGPQDMECYIDYPFAMEIVNGEIISLSADFQNKVKSRILEKLQVSEDDFGEYLSTIFEGDEVQDNRFESISDWDTDALVAAVGFNVNDSSFEPEDLEFLESPYGWEIKVLLENLGFELTKDVDEGSHGHGAYGVYFVK